MSASPLIAKLAWHDLRHDYKLSLYLIASLVAVIAPLLLLFGLKHGVVSQMQSALLRDPINLEIRMLGNGSLSSDWLATLAQRADVGFIVGQTRSLSAVADILKDRTHFASNIEILPSAAGDPLLPQLAQGLIDNDIALSEKLATQLQVQPGDMVRLKVQRKRQGTREHGNMAVRVAAILDPSFSRRPLVLVPMSLQIALERFFDGYQAPLLGILTGEPSPTQEIQFARARVYAYDLDKVAPLEAWLNTQRIETTSRLHEINNIKAINQVLGLIFSVIALTAVAGCLASLTGAFIANIDRKRKELAVLRLLGFQKTAIIGFVLTQAWSLTTLAFLCGLGVYAIGSLAFDTLLGQAQATDGFICEITITHVLTGLGLTWTVALIASLIGAVRAISVQPAESLREL
ncbi:ABC transporter permease [Castellaniella sp.]|uniref:ABC transporter permease n=1 Tax=Castellaniella sp. TaxID=1955812 RepID=UPI002B002A50|nr:FtsX-like permease family protein [Castellaniella sp.]